MKIWKNLLKVMEKEKQLQENWEKLLNMKVANPKRWKEELKPKKFK